MAALAQGTDQPPAERDLQVIRRWLPGQWDSIEQAYFEGRARRPGGNEDDAVENPRRQLVVTAEADGFRAALSGRPAERWSLALDPSAPDVTLLVTDRPDICPVRFRREAGQFRGEPAPDCAGLARRLLLADGQLWLAEGGSSYTRMRAARIFTCYVDIPGVGGGRAVPFRRYGPFRIADQGGETRFETGETPPRTLALRLRRVAWPYNNAPGIFTRNSLTLYVDEHGGNGSITNLAYGWAEPNSQRLGLNLKHLLANCAIVPLEAAEPEF